MRHQLCFLLVFLGSGCFHKSASAQCITTHPNGTECSGTTSPHNGIDTVGMCNKSITQPACSASPTSTVSSFLQCVGLPEIMSENSVEHMRNLKAVINTALDVYSFLRSSFSHGPILELMGEINVNTEALQFDDLDFVKLWLQVQLKPVVSRVSRQILSCLSTKNFSCETYQAVVKELSLHFSNMNPVRQRWIYMFFMYPYLARNGTAGNGCVSHGQNSEDWLMKNFGSFSAMASFKDFTTLNVVFNGLEVLHLLTPEQKAELILHPEIGGLSNGTIPLVFESLIKPLLENQHLNASKLFYNMTTSAPIHHSTTVGPGHHITTQHNGVKKVFSGFLMFLEPLGSFVKEFVSLTQQKNMTSMKSTTLTQAVLNWTLAELAGRFTQNITEGNEAKPTQTPSLGSFDITNIDDWFQHVVIPVLKRFLPHDQTEIPKDLTAVFYYLFSELNSDPHADEPDPSDVCSVIVDQRSCSIPNAVENLAHVLRCVAHTNLTFTEGNLGTLVIELSQMLNSLLEQYSTLNFTTVESHFIDVFGQLQTDSFTDENLHDVDYVRLWFQIKLQPLLPSVSEDFLSCLSAKNFSCETYQVLVMELGDHIPLMDEMRQQLIYSNFIHPFLLRHKYSDSSCISSTSSLEWLIENIGKFSIFAPLQHFFDLHSNFSALETLPVLSAKQMAELIVLPDTGPPTKELIINTVFDHLLESPMERNLKEFLNYLVMFATESMISCDSNKIIFSRLHQALNSAPPELEAVILAAIEEVMQTAPADCLPDMGCLVTPHNETRLCAEVNSTKLQHYLDTGNMTKMLCNFNIEQYACSSLMQFTAENLVTLLRCELSSNMTSSKETWKVFLTKVSGVLDEALKIFSNTTFHITSPSTSHFLDILGEIRIDEFTDEQLADVEFINKWFHGYLRPFLSSVSGEFVHCLSAQNFSCETFHHVVKEFSYQFPHMDQMRQELLSKYFILPFLSHNSSGPACISSTNSSVDWLQRNFGPFSVFVSLKHLLALNPDFVPLEALAVLSAKQMAELIVLRQTGPPQKDFIINTVFDHLLESPKERNLKEFLHYLIMFSKETLISCDSHNIIIRRLDQALPSVPLDLESVIRISKNELMQTAPGCIFGDLGCSLTPHNETRICSRVNSTALQHYLYTGNMTNMLCHFTIEQYACSELMQFTAENLVALLRCELSSNMTSSKETWKVFLTKVSGVLDEALKIFSNTTFHITSPSTSHFLDILGEIRIDRFTDEQLADVEFINKWFHGYLRPFLSSVSGEFVHCLSAQNFSCETFHHVVKEFSYQFPHMDQMRQELVSKYFILPFLSHNSSDPACISSTNSSVDWLHKNFGPFSVFVPLKHLLALNPDFVPLEALAVLSAKQMAELIVLRQTGPPQKDFIINTVFDHLLESPKERNLKEFLHYLVMFSKETLISCDSHNIIIRRLDQALPSVPLDLESVIRISKNELMQTAPGCIFGDVGCSLTPHNETRICSRVNSTASQHYLYTGNMTNMLCHFTIEQYACSELMQFTAENLVALLRCELSSNMTSSKETWKVFLTKVSGVLDEALKIFSNTTFHITSPSTSHFLDILGEIRIDRFTDEQLADVEFINKWFHGYLRPFLSSVSGEFVHCLSAQNFSCETFHHVVKEFSYQFPHMDQMRQELVSKYFILPFLSHNSSDPACISSTNSSVDWLHRNFGPFSVFVPLKHLLALNPDFVPLEALAVLSAKQMAELIVLRQTGPSQKDFIINTVFDHLLESPKERNLKEFLHYLIMFSKETLISCDSHNIIIRRLDQALPSVPLDLESVIRISKNELKQTAPGCIFGDLGCSLTPHNETRICSRVNSTALQHYLYTGNMTNMLCHFTIEQCACSELMQFTAENLVALLRCELSSNMTSSKETWKVFLTKVSGVLDEALKIFSNTTFHITSPSTSHFLDILGEIRIDRFTDEQLADVEFINKWFHGYLRPFLSSVSGEFVHCLSAQNFSCETFHHVVKEFSYQFPHMDQMRQELVSKYFILPFLSQNSSDPACISSTNSSVDWLHRNFGPFSVFVPLKHLLALNPDFVPLEALAVLSVKQTAELIVLRQTGPPQKDFIINTVFDHLLESPKERNLKEFLYYLIMFSKETLISCDSHNIIIRRLDQALPSVPLDLESVIRISKNELMQTAPGCIFGDVGCSLTPHNETRMCSRVNSTALQHYLYTGNMTNMLCHFTIEQYACSELMQFTAEDLVALLRCELSSNMTSSKETWKVFLTKVSGVLDEALKIFSNTTFHITSPSTSHFLDILGENRIDRFTDEQLADVEFINKWFHGYLRPFLSSVSGEFVHCLSAQNFSCETFHHVVKEFSYQFPHMDQMRQELVSKYFILPFLSHNSSDPACISSTNSSVDWLHRNFGPFSVFVPLKHLLSLNPDFVPLEALAVLSAKQMAELIVLRQTGPPQKDFIINTVFDHLLESPKERNLKEFLYYLIMFSKETLISCDSHNIIIRRLDQALPSVPLDLESVIRISKNELMQTAPGCIFGDLGCSLTPHNETRICSRVNSTALQHYLYTGNMTNMLCHFTIEQYACSELMQFTAENLVALLRCELSSNMTSSKETWKVFLTKVSGVLDEALKIFSNTTFHITSPSTSHFLDILGEIRIDRFTDEQLADVEFINKWFHGYLRPFLSSVSGEFVHCLSAQNFSCETFHHVVKEFSYQFPHMDQMRQELVSKYFILPFLSQNSSDPACISSTNSSVDWLHRNFGPFSVFVPLKHLLALNPDFVPLEALAVLSAKQMAELIVLRQTGPPQKDFIINTVFDHLLESPKERNLKEFLHYLVMFSTKENISCDSYRRILSRLNQAFSLVPTELVLTITTSSEALMGITPQDCMKVVFSGECDVTPINETKICAGVNSTVLQRNIWDGSITEMLCSFSIEQYACVSPVGLTAHHLVALLQCKLNSNVTSSKETWKLFITKVSAILDEALDLFSKMMASSSNPSTSHILDVIGEIRIDSFSATELRDKEFIKQWFQTKLNPFLPSVSKEFLSCLSTKNFSCETYQAIVKILSHRYAELDRHRQMLVYTEFIDMFLSQNDTSDPGCISSIKGSAEWLERNFGNFVVFASFTDLKRLYKGFSAMDALSLLTLNQLAEVASTPEQLKNPGDVNKLMARVKANNLATFFDIVSPAVQDHESGFPSSVRSAMLQQVFDRGNLSESSVSDAEILVWLQKRLRPLLPNLSMNHVAPFFNIVRQRQCVTSQQVVDLLNSIHSTLHSDTQREVYSHILASVKEPFPLRCYTNGSFYLFLEKSFRSFQFPNLTTFLSLMPQSQKSELINSIPPSDLSNFFMRPNVVDNNEELCTMLNNYDSTRDFLETQEDIPDDVRRLILPCVWPLALSSENETEVDLWFEKRLKLYLTFLTKDLISSTETHNAKCLPFRKIVFVLGVNYSYNDADFTQEDVYNNIKAYLNTGTKPKCYNATHPHLNSKAWFVNYIGEFVSHITLDDLDTFGTAAQLQIFSTNLDNVQLFNHSSIPRNVSFYYTELIYLEDSNFNPLLLPMQFRCSAPGSAFSQLNADESTVVLHNLTLSCTELEPEVAAALAGNFKTVSADTIAALGSESVGLSTGQIIDVPSSEVISSLSTLSAVTGWNRGQLLTIIQLLLKGNFAIASSASLRILGSLVAGVPSSIITSMDSSEILNTSTDPVFIANMLTAPTILQQVYVNKIITVNSELAVILENVPDAMATEIPRTLLEFSPESNLHEKINRKKWKHEQAVLFFGIMAAGFKDPNKISSTVLQGFTCTRVQTFDSKTIRNLIRACKRKGANKVVLRETQSTCMYNSIKDFDPDSFQQYPPNVLLYYNYETVRTKCKTYFAETGYADFDILSLKEKKAALLDNAKSCLGITGTSINRTNVEILGNMCCTLDGSYIEASDPLILEKLKNCNDLSEVQVTAVETVLLTGNTQYGDPSTWNIQTLKNLEILPLYMSTDFWRRFRKRDKRRFLKSFLKARRRDKTKKRKLKKLFKESNRSLRSKRAVVRECSVGNITQVVISDDAFPFGYDAAQFNACLTATIVKDNLAALTEKVLDDDLQRILLDKLNQAFPTGLADEQVQVLGSVSRVASTNDIKKWNVTQIDTLAALTVPDDGQWEPDKIRAIITNYLGLERTLSNSLGTAELNSIGGTNLCSLDASLLKNINPTSLRDANALTISNCSAEKKTVLFTVADRAFSVGDTISLTTYQYMQQYLGGASRNYIKRLTASNVSMDISTFISLDEQVINTLSVDDVQLLLGNNIPDLKTFENQTQIANWISRQLQSNLNSLNLGIEGGRDDPIPTGVGVINTTTTATAAGGATTTATDVTTTGHGGTSTKSAQVLHLLLALAFTVLQILQ